MKTTEKHQVSSSKAVSQLLENQNALKIENQNADSAFQLKMKQVIQQQGMEEEELQGKFKEPIQRVEEEEDLQMKSQEPLQRAEMDEEELQVDFALVGSPPDNKFSDITGFFGEGCDSVD